MRYEEAKQHRQTLEMQEREHGHKLSEISNRAPKTSMGLTAESIRNTPEWQTAKRNHAQAFKKLQDFNSHFTKNYKKEYAEERDADRKRLQERHTKEHEHYASMTKKE